ncbi:hypothetical protein [Bradyrhizobium ottawaense]
MQRLMRKMGIAALGPNAIIN